MSWQLVLSLIVVGVALAYLALVSWRSWRNVEGDGCCAKAQTNSQTHPVFIPSDSVKIRCRQERQERSG